MTVFSSPDTRMDPFQHKLGRRLTNVYNWISKYFKKFNRAAAEALQVSLRHWESRPWCLIAIHSDLKGTFLKVGLDIQLFSIPGRSWKQVLIVCSTGMVQAETVVAFSFCLFKAHNIWHEGTTSKSKRKIKGRLPDHLFDVLFINANSDTKWEGEHGSTRTNRSFPLNVNFVIVC